MSRNEDQVLKIHFLNVGHGDCTIVEHPSGRITMIDINNSKSLSDGDIDALAAHQGLTASAFKSARMIEGRYRSWEDYYKSLLVDPADYFRSIAPGASVFRYIQTHPDMDHLSGLHRFFWEDRIPLSNFWDVDHRKELDEDSFVNSPYSYADWLVYRLLRHGFEPGPDGSPQRGTHKVICNLRGASAQYWADDGIEVLSPTAGLIAECEKSEQYNDCSYVIKISHAGRTVILPGDAEESAWLSILDGVDDIRCDILKASHHGRESGYHEGAVDAMSPEVVICSVGKKPSTDASDEYAGHGAAVLSTRYHGTITATIWDDGHIWIENPKDERIYTID